jgi:hypothetical protein
MDLGGRRICALLLCVAFAVGSIGCQAEPSGSSQESIATQTSTAPDPTTTTASSTTTTAPPTTTAASLGTPVSAPTNWKVFAGFGIALALPPTFEVSENVGEDDGLLLSGPNDRDGYPVTVIITPAVELEQRRPLEEGVDAFLTAAGLMGGANVSLDSLTDDRAFATVTQKDGSVFCMAFVRDTATMHIVLYYPGPASADFWVPVFRDSAQTITLEPQ